MQKEIRVDAGHPYPLGVYREADGIHVSMIATGKRCGILLFDQNKKKIGHVELSLASRMGKLCYGKIDGKSNEVLKAVLDSKEPLLYQLYADDEIIFDMHMKVYQGHEKFGVAVEAKEIFGVLHEKCFDWEDDSCPRIPYEECAIYCMHVRGFTKHSSSSVKGKGTFEGIIEKIPYLEQLGITTLELMPIYELHEAGRKRKQNTTTGLKMPISTASERTSQEMLISVSNDMHSKDKVNYWGYETGFYYAPRNAYAMSGNGDFEFRKLVKELHKKRMEVVLQFYFPKNVLQSEILSILRYWKEEYHVDGFHIKGENIPHLMIGQEPGLADTKLFYDDCPMEQIYEPQEHPAVRNLAGYRDEYMYGMRRFLKGDEDMLSEVLHLMRKQPAKIGQINYLTNYYGFTLADMVSFERKHNEANGEENRDGNDYNHTWNCGVEGKSRKKTIVTLRNKQIRNALCMLMFSQGTPLIFMGDEFGNSQNGNNNPYCQDNEISWLNWKNLVQNKEHFEYVKQLITLRKNHPILRKSTELRLMDYIFCGFPDLSYHATKAWQPDMSNYVRHIGLLYCGKYAKKTRTEDDDFFYIAMNMHWEAHEFALPKLPKEMNWHLLLDTQNWEIDEETGKLLEDQQCRVVDPRSIQVYISKKGNGKK